jgi:hypothetical protein
MTKFICILQLFGHRIDRFVAAGVEQLCGLPSYGFSHALCGNIPKCQIAGVTEKQS